MRELSKTSSNPPRIAPRRVGLAFWKEYTYIDEVRPHRTEGIGRQNSGVSLQNAHKELAI